MRVKAAIRLATTWGALALGLVGIGTARGDDAPRPLDEAAGKMTVPDGFRVDLVAGEPDVRQPISLTFDGRGRLWVVECFAYPDWIQDGKPGTDRVVVFEDTDGDGKADKRTVFLDNGTNLSGIEIGFGGVWLCATPNLLFVPDRDGDDKPDGPAEVVLDGWDLKARHNVFNGLVWGPDGWLWGCNGILSNSRVGRPGTPDAERTPINCGVWRYHPTRKVFEVVANGTTNPWGLDFDESGEAFITNCVIPHLFHVTPGASFERMFGNDFNPHAYQLIPSCADHVHWDVGAERWLDIRSIGVSPTTDKAGGGHAHSGAVVYLGDNWPDSYRGSILMGNIHGRRINRDRLERKGSGYVAKHEPDFLMANDPWFRGIGMKTGPDGALYVIDWSDTGECHEHDADGAHRENGRIYRVAYGEPKVDRKNLAELDDAALVALQGHKNEWYVRQARRVLQERAAAGKDLAAAHKALREALDAKAEAPKRLRALWALNATGGVKPADLATYLDDPSEDVRAWAVRLLVDDPKTLDKAAAEAIFATAGLAESPKLRLATIAAARRLPSEPMRAALLTAVVKNAADADDPNIPYQLWYAIEPSITDDVARLSEAALFASESPLPLIRTNIARRMVEASPEKALTLLMLQLTNREIKPDAARDVFAGMMTGLRGRKGLKLPAGWSKLVEKMQAIDHALPPARLSLMLGDPDAAARLGSTAVDESKSADVRRDAVDALAEARAPGFAAGFLKWVDDPVLSTAAIRGLSVYDDKTIPAALLGRFKAFPDEGKTEAVATLASRPEWALALLEAIGQGAVDRRDVSAPIARQIQTFGKKDLDAALAKHWGAIRATTGDKAARIATFKERLAPAALAAADRAKGRQVFVKTCGGCHQLYQDGHAVGPNLTGSNRDNLDYLLENVLDPSASVANEYKLVNVATTDGRIVAGIVRERTDSALVLQVAEGGRIVVPRDEIEAEKMSPASLMPEGLFDRLSDEELRDLTAYLTSKRPAE